MADEIINAAKGSSNSYAIKKKVKPLSLTPPNLNPCHVDPPPLHNSYYPSSPQDELERVAKSNR